MSTEQFPPESQKAAESKPVDGAHRPAIRCAEIEALMPAYSLGATDPEETLLVDEQLIACPAAVTALAEYKGLAEALLYSAPPAVLPPQLEQRLQAALHQPRTPPMPGVAGKRVGPWRFLSAPAWRWSTAQWAASLAFLLLVGLNFWTIQQNRQLRSQTTRQSAQYEQLHQALLVLLATEDMRELNLLPQQAGSQAEVDLLWNPKVKVAVLYARNFPPSAPDQVYQLWLVRHGWPISGGTFTVKPDGLGLLLFPVVQPLDRLESIAVTVEAAGGSAQPTTPPLVRKQLAQ